MKEKESVCIIVPSLHKGGLERVASILANEISKNGYNVSIITVIPDLSIDFVIDKDVRIFSPKFGYKKGLIFKMRTLFFLIKSLISIKPVSVLSFSEVFNSFSIIACKFLSVKIYVSDRSSPIKKLPMVDRLFKKFTYPFANGILAQTNIARDKLLKFNSNINVIPNPLRDINDVHTKDNNLKCIVSVGRLVKSKNFSELIEIFYEVNNLDWKLIIVGDGPEYENLRELIVNLKLVENVFLVGKQDDVDKYLSMASIFAFTSLSEGFPNVLNEAMAFPLAVVSYDCIAGPQDMIDNDKNGFLIPVGDKGRFTEVLLSLMLDPSLRMRLKSNSINNRILYSKDIITKKVIEFII